MTGKEALTISKIGKDTGDSHEQVRRYIRLTELVPEILSMVDERQIAFRPAVEISYLSDEQQYSLLEAMEFNDATPSLEQAIKMKKFQQDGKLIPKSVPKGQEADFVVKALEFYHRHLQRQRGQER